MHYLKCCRYNKWTIDTCCKNSLSGLTDCSQSSVWNITWVSFKKFFPKINNSLPPPAGQLVRDFLHISGMPGGWAARKKIILVYRRIGKIAGVGRITRGELTASDGLWCCLKGLGGTIVVGNRSSKYHSTSCGFLFAARRTLFRKSMFNVDISLFQNTNAIAPVGK